MNDAQRRTCSGSGSSQSGSPASSPVLTTSARPLRRSASGRVVRRAGSQTTRAGQWNAPTAFFARGRSTAVFPPMPASTCPTSVVGTAVHGTPRMCVAATKPATSVVEPPPSATSPPSRPIRRLVQSRSSTAGVLAASPARHLVPLDVARPERELCPHAVDAGDVRVGHERERAVARDEVAEGVQPVGLDVHARRGEHDAVHVERRGVGDVVVDGLPLAMEGAEGVGVARQRPVGALDPGPRRLGVDVEQHREGARRERRARALGEDSPAAERHDDGLAVAEHVVDGRLLERAEGGLPVVLEELRDRPPRAGLQLVVEIDEAPPEPCGGLAPEGRLARAHEPRERDVAAERVRGHGAASASSASRSQGTPAHRARSGA